MTYRDTNIRACSHINKIFMFRNGFIATFSVRVRTCISWYVLRCIRFWERLVSDCLTMFTTPQLLALFSQQFPFWDQLMRTSTPLTIQKSHKISEMQDGLLCRTLQIKNVKWAALKICGKTTFEHVLDITVINNNNNNVYAPRTTIPA